MPKKPDARHLEVIKEMFEASVDGEAYDAEKWAEFYKPYGLDAPSTPKATDDKPAADDTKVEETKVETPVVETPEVKEEAGDTADSTGNAKAQAILEKIRTRTKA